MANVPRFWEMNLRFMCFQINVAFSEWQPVWFCHPRRQMAAPTSPSGRQARESLSNQSTEFFLLTKHLMAE
jgi:hypothetical protein